uniref:DUF3326 domain-containing protein n=1 Tax=Compsopogon caeruleus TaxID=31354 RepID=A0A7S1TAC4_9RHOD
MMNVGQMDGGCRGGQGRKRRGGGPAWVASRRDWDHPYVTSLVVPTGIGASMGGYAGDAIPVARLLGEVADLVLTHPNVLNGAQLYWQSPKLLYVEGYALDQFMRGAWQLDCGHHGNRVGLVFDCAMDEELMLRHVQVAHAARATLGLRLGPFVRTDRPVGVQLRSSAGSSASWGTIQNPDTLLRASRKLVNDMQCDAIAVVVNFPDEDEDMLESYRSGQGVDPIAGAEAVISHLLTRELQVPCAHAPALPPLPVSAAVNPKACAEELGYTFLPSVLFGLSRAPRIVTSDHSVSSDPLLRSHDVNSLVLPFGACGGGALLGSMHRAASDNDFLLILVEENSSRINVSASDLGYNGNLAVAKTYLEAAGIVTAHRAGIALESLKPTVPAVTEVR